ncbi:MAG: hypothetical protein LBT20_02135 [Clostridiales bacterium]|jgi:hypothetical protein|nr:hypothetical protein [Clostridiales bacterium]
MFYRKKIDSPAAKGARLGLPVLGGPDIKNNESILPKSTAVTVYNYRLTDGVLKNGFGFQRASMPSLSEGTPFEMPEYPNAVGDFCEFFVYRRFDAENRKPDDRLIVRDSYGYHYMASLTESGAFVKLQMGRAFFELTGVNYRYNGEDIALFATDIGLYLCRGAGATLVPSAPMISSMCVHSERIYAGLKGDNTGIWFSDTFDPTNWNVSLDDGGFIDFADEGGYVRKVVQFADSVYIFRDFSIERLVAFGEQREFSVTKICTLGSKILPFTITSCDGYLMFMLRDGLYVFDGYAPKRVFDKVTELIDTEIPPHGCFLKNKYYLTAKADFGEPILWENGTGKNALFEFDIKSGGVNITRGLPFNDAAAIKTTTAEKLFVSFTDTGSGELYGRIFETNDSGCFCETELPSLWRSADNVQGMSERRKLIRSASFLSRYDATLTVTVDGREYDYPVKGSGTPATVRIKKCGKSFSIAFSGAGKAEIKDVVVEIDVL